jgi:lipoprotein-releasing system permease protein
MANYRTTMNTELFIARRLYGEKGNSNHLSRKIINIALVGIALGISVMLISVAIVTGFKKEIRDKVIGFGAHIQVVNFDSNFSYETAPVIMKQSFPENLGTLDNVKSIHAFGTKPGIIKTDNYIQGIVLKGVTSNYDWEFFSKHLSEGNLPDLSGVDRSPEVIISANLGNLLSLRVDDPIFMYFINQDEQIPRIRQFRVSGIYNTSLQEFDDLFIIGDLRQIQHINNWDPDQVSGFEINLKNFNRLSETEMAVRERIVNYSPATGSTLHPVSVLKKYPQIFDWLSILDMNVWVILTLMVLVAGFNMISALLVLILERSSMIGILKSLGSRDKSLRKIFLYLSAFLLSRGMLWGNLLGIGLLLAQKYLKLIKLDPSSYYMDFVPVSISPVSIAALNLGALLLTMIMLVFPAWFVSRISPDQSIRFD